MWYNGGAGVSGRRQLRRVVRSLCWNSYEPGSRKEALAPVLRFGLLEGLFGALAQLRSLVVCRCTLAFSSVRAYVHHAAHMNPEAGIEEKMAQHMIQARTVKIKATRGYEWEKSSQEELKMVQMTRG